MPGIRLKRFQSRVKFRSTGAAASFAFVSVNLKNSDLIFFHFEYFVSFYYEPWQNNRLNIGRMFFKVKHKYHVVYDI